VDPSGLFSRATIEASLKGKSIQEAFGVGNLGRAGLYHLLRDAKHGSLVFPSIIDFGESELSVRVDRYPLRDSNPSANGVLLCNANNELRIRTNFGKMDLANYLNLLEIIAQHQETISWRDDTMRLHYYSLYERFGSGLSDTKFIGFYDDLGPDPAYLPDVIGVSGSFALMGGGEVGVFLDRYGRGYVKGVLSMGLNLSLPLNILSKFSGAGNRYEGYYWFHTPETHSRDYIPDPQRLQWMISRPHIGISIFGTLDDQYEAIKWYSEGYGWDPGVSFNLGGTFGPFHKDAHAAWDWVDGKDSVFQSYSVVDLQNDLVSPQNYTPQECSCGEIPPG
jgi:hypothetical protein